MKDYSAAQLKKGIRRPLHALPREGSAIRELYDILYQYKGHIIEFNFGKISSRDRTIRDFYNRLNYLRLWYGMDIVPGGKGKITFVGETIGSAYVDYRVKQPLKVRIKK